MPPRSSFWVGGGGSGPPDARVIAFGLRGDQMSLDYSLFAAHMRHEQPFAVLLKGHLWIESCLNRLISISFERPTFDLDRLQFSRKVDLASALGLISEGEAAALRLLNKLRNRLAHDLDGEPETAEVNALAGSLTGSSKHAFALFREAHEIAPDSLRLAHWFYVVLMTLEFNAMVTEYEKVNKQVLETYRIVSALSQKLGRTTSDEELRRTHNVPPAPDPRDAWHNDRDEAGKLFDLGHLEPYGKGRNYRDDVESVPPEVAL